MADAGVPKCQQTKWIFQAADEMDCRAISVMQMRSVSTCSYWYVNGESCLTATQSEPVRIVLAVSTPLIRIQP